MATTNQSSAAPKTYSRNCSLCGHLLIEISIRRRKLLQPVRSVTPLQLLEACQPCTILRKGHCSTTPLAVSTGIPFEMLVNVNHEDQGHQGSMFADGTLENTRCIDPRQARRCINLRDLYIWLAPPYLAMPMLSAVSVESEALIDRKPLPQPG